MLPRGQISFLELGPSRAQKMQQKLRTRCSWHPHFITKLQIKTLTSVSHWLSPNRKLQDLHYPSNIVDIQKLGGRAFGVVPGIPECGSSLPKDC